MRGVTARAAAIGARRAAVLREALAEAAEMEGALVTREGDRLVLRGRGLRWLVAGLGR